MPGPGATREEERIPALDVLRGLALLGILQVNLYAFALPAAPSDDAVRFMSPAPTEALAHGVVSALFQEKFITLFALLFGAGLSLQHARGLARNESGFYPRTLWRLALLGGLGLLHGLGLWYGDILFIYAGVGAAALVLVWAPPAALLPLGAVALAIPILLMLLFSLAVGLPGVPAEEVGPRTLEQALAQPDLRGPVGPVGVGREVLLFRGGTYADMLGVRASMWATMLAAVLMVYGWRVLGLFFVGMAAHKLGLLAPDARRRPVLLALVGLALAVGLPIEVFTALVRLREPTDTAFVMRLEALHSVGSLCLALGYAATVLLLPPAWIARLRPLGDVGRLALTNYLGQTVVCTTVFYAYGLGWFATLTRAQLFWFGVGLWVVQLALSGLWLRWFVIGPVEWAWRSLTWGKVEPLRRRSVVPSQHPPAEPEPPVEPVVVGEQRQEAARDVVLPAAGRGQDDVQQPGGGDDRQGAAEPPP